MLRYLLDTDICIYVIKNRPDYLRKIFNRHSAHIGISSITLAELIYGVEKSVRPERNLSVVENFAARLTVLPFDENAAAHAGQVRAALEKAGLPIGAWDLLIAGHARSEGLVFVTNNQKEFRRVEGLRLENWIKS